MNTHIEHIRVDPSEESDAGLWPLQVPDGFTVVSVEEYEALKKAAELLRVAVELEKARLDLSEIPDAEINNRPQAKMELRKHASNWFANALALLEKVSP